MQRNGWKQGAVVFGGITLMAVLPSTASATVFEFDEDGNVSSRPSLNYIQRAQLPSAGMPTNIELGRSDLAGPTSSAIALMTEVPFSVGSFAPTALDGQQIAARIPHHAITFVEVGSMDENMRLPLQKPLSPLFHSTNEWRGKAISSSEAHHVPPSVFVALIEAESGFNPKAVSPKGAIGLTQLMPATAKALGVDPHDPEQNLIGGARYLRQQYERFGTWPLALAAYNAGPTRVAKLGRIPNIPETKAFVARVMKASGLDSKSITTASN